MGSSAVCSASTDSIRPRPTNFRPSLGLSPRRGLVLGLPPLISEKCGKLILRRNVVDSTAEEYTFALIQQRAPQEDACIIKPVWRFPSWGINRLRPQRREWNVEVANEHSSIGWESWFKVGLSALPTLFTVFGLWLYWGDNPLAILAPSLGFWGVTLSFYLFTHIYVPERRSPFYLAVCTSGSWLVSSITAHNLGRFLASSAYTGVVSVVRNKDFRYSYGFSILGFLLALVLFIRHEPRIVAQVESERARS
jgi:hypothetical protein